jgi:hypothetical protein
MPFSILSNEQIQELLAEQPRLMSVPGVALVWVDFLDPRRTQVGVVVTVYSGNSHGIPRLPVSVAGLPVIVKVEDHRTSQLMEIIDPRRNGGAWPALEASAGG